MMQQNIVANIWAYVRMHWFKFGILIVILFACFRKELSFSVRLNAAKDTKKIEQKKAVNDNKITAVTTAAKAEDTPLSILGNIFASGSSDKMPDMNEALKINYMHRFAQVAVAERKKYGIPSSVILASAMRHSFAGHRDITAKLNNHFALPCTFEWSGVGESFNNKCYRKYENAWTSFRDHSIFITSGAFSKLHSLGDKNYKAWAEGLQNLGYPTGNDDLAKELIDIIETYGLEKLDKL